MSNHCIWVCGPANVGKSTTCYNLLQKRLRNYVTLDGDAFRRHMDNKNLTFSREDIFKSNRRCLEKVKQEMKSGWDVLVAMITPYAEMRKQIKDELGDSVVRVLLNASEEVRSSRINFVKSAIEFESGEYDLTYDTYRQSEDFIRDDILNHLRMKGYLG